MKKIHHINVNQSRTGMAILILDRKLISEYRILTDFKGHYKMTKQSIYQENIIILNVYVSNNRASKYMEQKLKELPDKIVKLTISVRNFNLFCW